MALLKWTLALALLGGCYSPQVRDCTVTCTGVSECAAGQVCGDDHFCAAPEVAGTCEAIDAGTTPPDDARVDAPPDALVRVTLHVHVQEKGKVAVTGVGICDQATGGDCMYLVLRGAPLELTPIQVDKPFEKWTGGPCDGEPATCSITPTGNVDVTARFLH